MSDNFNQIEKKEHDDIYHVKKVSLFADNGDGTLVRQKNIATEDTLAKLVGFDIPPYDYISLSYTGDNLTGVVYKTGGSGGTTVATLTLAYTGSVLNTITKT
jgi:hypothetical protein